MAGGTIRIEIGVKLDSVPGSTFTDSVEIPQAEWDALGPQGQRDRLDELAAAARDREVTAWAMLEDEPVGEDSPWRACPRLVGTADGR